MKNENDNPDATDRTVSNQKQSSSRLDASRRDFLKVGGGVLAVGIGTGLAGSAVAAEGETLLVDNYDGNPSWPSQNDLGKWTGAGGFANGDGEIVDETLRLEYDGAGWFGSNVGMDISAYDRLELVVRGDSGGEEKDFQVKLGTTAGVLAELTDDSIGTSFSTVSIDLGAVGVQSSLSSVRFNFWSGARSRSSAIEIEAIRFASGSSNDGGTGDQSSVTKPANLTVTNMTASSIAVNWDPSSASGTSVDHYVVTAGGNSMSVPASTTQATIDGLESDTSYTVRVTAVGADGTKSDAATVSATTDPSGGGGSGQTVSVQLSDSTVNPDGTTTASIVLSEAPNGVAGYDLTLSVANAGVATVTDATILDTFIAPGGGISIANDGSSVTIRAADLVQNVQSGATDITLATVTLTGESSGTTQVNLSIDTIDDDNGSSMSLSTAGATLTVS